MGASEVEYVASYRDVASLSASGPERNHRCEEAFERVRVVLTLDPEPLAWGGRYRAPGGWISTAGMSDGHPERPIFWLLLRPVRPRRRLGVTGRHCDWCQRGQRKCHSQ